MRPPLVSIIVTNYNYERFIGDCLASIVAQTYRETEVFIVDDVSTDNSVETIREFIATNKAAKDFQLIALEVNGGQMNAFIEGFARAKGAFIVFVDADDYLFPDFVETHVAAHLNPQYSAGLTCSNEVIVDSENRLISGTIEKWHRAAKADHRLAPNFPVWAVETEEWRKVWPLSSDVAPDQPVKPLLFIEPDGNIGRTWFWSTTSGIMFRRGVLEAAFTDTVRSIRICADYYVLHFCHLLGGTLLIQTAHGCYRRHGGNNFALSASIGRGTLRGASDNHDFREVDALLEAEILRNYGTIRGLVGEPRTMQILSGMIPPHHLGSALAALGTGRPVTKLQFLVMFCIRYFRRNWNEMVRKLRFA